MLALTVKVPIIVTTVVTWKSSHWGCDLVTLGRKLLCLRTQEEEKATAIPNSVQGRRRRHLVAALKTPW